MSLEALQNFKNNQYDAVIYPIFLEKSKAFPETMDAQLTINNLPHADIVSQQTSA